MIVCSTHFTDGEPTTDNPYAAENLRYDSARRVKNIAPSSNCRKLYHDTNDEDQKVLHDSGRNEEYVDNFLDISGVEALSPHLNDGDSMPYGTNQEIETEPGDVLSEEIENQEPISNGHLLDVSKEPSKSPCSVILLWFPTLVMLVYAIISIATVQSTLQTLKQKVKRLE